MHVNVDIGIVDDVNVETVLCLFDTHTFGTMFSVNALMDASCGCGFSNIKGFVKTTLEN